MKVRILSDTHLESYDGDYSRATAKIECTCPENDREEILVLPGDLGYAIEKNGEFNPEYEKFLIFLKSKWQYIVLVPGNTEYQGMPNFESLVATEAALELKCQELGINFLQKGVIKVDDYFFVGCTLWSFISSKEWRNLKKEDKKIFMDKEIYRLSYVDNLEWLNSILTQLQKDDSKCVVVTHYPPMTTLQKLECKWKDDDGVKHSSSHIEHFAWTYKDTIKAWICGHVHEVQAKEVGNVPIFMNPMGESDESLKFSSGLVEI